jgi:DNA-binding response OmpR family regulator
LAILVVACAVELDRPGGAFETLKVLGLEVTTSVPGDRAIQAAFVDADEDVPRAREVLARLRGSMPGTPLILGIARRAVHQLTAADGFDDFVLQPYDNGELLARLERMARDITASESSVTVDVDAREVRVEGRIVELTRQEFALLRLFMQNRGRVFTRDQILDRAWGARFGSTRTVDTHVKRLREKLGSAGQALETVRGVGYKMVEIPQNATGTSSITMR